MYQTQHGLCCACCCQQVLASTTAVLWSEYIVCKHSVWGALCRRHELADVRPSILGRSIGPLALMLTCELQLAICRHAELYCVPSVLLQPQGGAIRALVLAPTRELTAQIKAEAEKLLTPHAGRLGVQVCHRFGKLVCMLGAVGWHSLLLAAADVCLL